MFAGRGIYPILDVDFCQKHGFPLEMIVEQWQQIPAISYYQLRGKHLTEAQYEAIYLKLRRQFSLPIIINDFWQIAISHRAFGLHLGKEDFRQLSQKEQGKIIAQKQYLGTSSHSLLDLQKLDSNIWDYSGIGPIFPTEQKVSQNAVLGVERLPEFAQISPVPLIVIGGITDANIQQIWQKGDFRIAAIRSMTLKSEREIILSYLMYPLKR